ncbi:MAG: hypothetical protein L3J02_03605 [Henriciella sp.]|nr:hypothetical protein [Henriciella sp.]
MIRTIIISIATLGFTASAFASTTFTATLETPLSKAEKVVAAKVLWSCDGATCTANLSRKSVNISTCKKVVKKIGKVVEFSNTNDALSEADLATCNSVAK